MNMYYGATNDFPYFGNVKHTSAALVAFTEIVNVTNHNGLSVLPDTLRVIRTGFASMAGEQPQYPLF